MPDFASRTRVNRPDEIGYGEIHHAVGDQRRSFNRALIDVGAKDPREAQRVDVTRIDLIQRAVTATRIIAVIARPPISRRLPYFSGIETALSERRPSPKRPQSNEKEGSDEFHLSDSR